MQGFFFFCGDSFSIFIDHYGTKHLSKNLEVKKEFIASCLAASRSLLLFCLELFLFNFFSFFDGYQFVLLVDGKRRCKLLVC